MSKTADEAWERWRTAKYSSDRNDVLRPAVEAIAREIAREEVRGLREEVFDLAETIADDVNILEAQIADFRSRMKERTSTQELVDDAVFCGGSVTERVADMVWCDICKKWYPIESMHGKLLSQQESDSEDFSEEGSCVHLDCFCGGQGHEDDEHHTSTPTSNRIQCADCGSSERIGWSKEGHPFRCEDCWVEHDSPTPSEGEKGEVELPVEVRAAIAELRPVAGDTMADRLGERVERLQRERDETEKAMHATRRTNAEIGERLTEAETEIAHLRENNERLGGMLDRFGEHVQKRDQQVAHLRREKDEAITRVESLKAIADREAQLAVDRGDEIQELKAKIANLSDPKNWEIEITEGLLRHAGHKAEGVLRLVPQLARVNYVGPTPNPTKEEEIDR